MNFPINLVLRGRRVVVIGGGTVATRKAARLINTGAIVVVVSPECSEPLEAMEDAGKLSITRRKYERGDLDGAALVFAASDDEATNFEVAEHGHQVGALVSVVNAPEAGDFSLPALVELGGLRLAIDTQGSSPALSKALRKHLEETLHPGWGRAAVILGALRAVVDDRDDEDIRANFWRALVEQLPEAATRDVDGVREWIHDAMLESQISLAPHEVETLLKLV